MGDRHAFVAGIDVAHFGPGTVADINESRTKTTVTFTADTPEAEEWMEAHYGSSTVTFTLPSQVEAARHFRRLAEEGDLAIVERF